MRLLRLYLGDYRVVRDLDIRFGPPGDRRRATQTQGASYSLDFLVGVNSTGKSTVLRALADLVRKLERHAPIPYAFELEYDLGPPDQKRQVKLSNLPDDFDAETSPPEATTDSGSTVSPHSSVAMSSRPWPWRSRLAAKTSGNASTRQRHSALAIQTYIRELSPIEQALRELPGRPPVQNLWKNSNPL